eukprot:753538-Hanusia_phi.AAC.1
MSLPQPHHDDLSQRFESLDSAFGLSPVGHYSDAEASLGFRSSDHAGARLNTELFGKHIRAWSQRDSGRFNF